MNPEKQIFISEAEKLSTKTVETLGIISDVQKLTEQAIQNGQEKLKRIEDESGLSKEDLEIASREFHLGDQMAQNEADIKKLNKETIKKISALVEILDDSLSPEQIDSALKEHGVNLELAGVGAFYDTFEIDDTEEVLKVLKLNYLFNQEQAIRILARHHHEANRLRESFGEEFVPPAVFIYPERMKDVFETELSRVESGAVKLYDITTFAKIQIDRRLQERYARLDVAEERGLVDTAFGSLGQALKNNGVFRSESAGVMVEKKIRGITFQELIDRGPRGGDLANWELLKNNAKIFLARLVKFNEQHSFLWHSFDSDNVVIEVDKNGEPTGQIQIIDLNFTEKSFESLRKTLSSKMKVKIIDPLLEYFEINSDELKI